MSRFVVLGTVAVLSFATAASALIFTPTQDNRLTYAGTVVFDDPPDMANDSPSSPFSLFNSEIWAGSVYDGFFADAQASQNSQIGSMYIQGSGSVSAQIGVSFDDWPIGDTDTHTDGPGLIMQSNGVSAGSQSLLEILFSIDMDAQYDLTGFIDAGIGLAVGTIDYGSNQSASIVLFDIDHSVTLVDESVTDGNQAVSASGLLGPGNYRFTVSADVELFGGSASEADTLGINGFPGDIYSASAGFESINLTLTGRDKPIPEPVTTTLAGLGLGALAFQTSRRRRA